MLGDWCLGCCVLGGSQRNQEVLALKEAGWVVQAAWLVAKEESHCLVAWGDLGDEVVAIDWSNVSMSEVLYSD